MRPLLSFLFSCTLCGAVDLQAEWNALEELVQALPAPPASVPLAAAPPFAVADLAGGAGKEPGIWATRGRLVLAGKVVVDQGPVAGLEKLACLHGGKVHESYVQLDSANATLIKALCIGMLGLQDGVPAEEDSAIPAIGQPVAITAWWRPSVLLQPDLWHTIPASSLIADRVTGTVYPPVPFVFTGSRIATIDQTDREGRMITTQRFMLEVDLSLANNFDHADGLLASPFPFAMRDEVFEVNAAIAPKDKSVVYLVLEVIEAPLALVASADGTLRHGEEILDDAALAALLQQVFTAEPPPTWRFIAVQVPAEPVELRLALRRRLLAAAGTAGVWALPIFTPGG